MGIFIEFTIIFAVRLFCFYKEVSLSVKFYSCGKLMYV